MKYKVAPKLLTPLSHPLLEASLPDLFLGIRHLVTDIWLNYFKYSLRVGTLQRPPRSVSSFCGARGRDRLAADLAVLPSLPPFFPQVSRSHSAIYWAAARRPKNGTFC